MGLISRLNKIRNREAGKDGPVDQNGDFYNPNGDIPNPDTTPTPSRMDKVKANFRDFGRAASNRAHDALGGLAKVWNKGKEVARGVRDKVNDWGERGVERLLETKPGDALLKRLQRNSLDENVRRSALHTHYARNIAPAEAAEETRNYRRDRGEQIIRHARPTPDQYFRHGSPIYNNSISDPGIVRRRKGPVDPYSLRGEEIAGQERRPPQEQIAPQAGPMKALPAPIPIPKHKRGRSNRRRYGKRK